MTEEIRTLSEDEVREVTLENTTGDTTSGTVSGSVNEVWYKKIIQYGEPMRRFKQLCRINEDLVNASGDTAHFYVAGSNLDMSVSQTGSVAEGSSMGATHRQWTKLDNLSDTSVQIGSDDYYVGGIALSKEAVLNSKVDLVKQARYAVANALVQDMDEQIRDSMVTSASTNVDVSSSNVLTPDAIAEGMKNIETNDFDPQALVISPSHQYDLRTDSQFVNAAEYGDNEVVMNGEIGKYLGLKVITSSNISSEAVMAGTNRAGEKVGEGLVIKEKPHIDYEYHKGSREHRVYYDQSFKSSTLQGDALCTIQTA